MNKAWRKADGFTLLEAMVALVIFSISAMGIYSWINTNLIALNKLSNLAANEFVVNSAIERLKLVDMTKETEGAFDVDSYHVDWRSQLVEPWRNGVAMSGAITIYDLALVDVQLFISKNGVEAGHFSYRNTLYKQVRQPPKQEGEN